MNATLQHYSPATGVWETVCDFPVEVDGYVTGGRWITVSEDDLPAVLVFPDEHGLPTRLYVERLRDRREGGA